MLTRLPPCWCLLTPVLVTILYPAMSPSVPRPASTETRGEWLSRSRYGTSAATSDTDQSEQSIESADQSQNGILTKTVFGSSAGAGISLLLVSKPGVVVQEDSAGVHSEPRPAELGQAPGPRSRAQQLVVASGHLDKNV